MKANVINQERAPAVPRTTLTASRKTSLAAGILYLITFISVPQFILYAAVREPNTGGGWCIPNLRVGAASCASAQPAVSLLSTR